MTDRPKCIVCGEPMPEGEETLQFHGLSGPCPKPPLNSKNKHEYYIIKHFPKNNFGADYSAVDVVIDGETKISFGDAYHEKGMEKAMGYLNGWARCCGDDPLLGFIKCVDDYNEYGDAPCEEDREYKTEVRRVGKYDL